jgi:hypothetical protein
MLIGLRLRQMSVVFCFCAAILMPQLSQAGVQSYREWKLSQIHQVEQRIQKLKEKMALERGLGDPNLQMDKDQSVEGQLSVALNEQIKHETQNLELAEDLSISDYFAGYLTKQASLESAIHDVSGKLTAEEVAELMSTYAQHFFQTRPSSVKAVPSADSGL